MAVTERDRHPEVEKMSQHLNHAVWNELRMRQCLWDAADSNKIIIDLIYRD